MKVGHVGQRWLWRALQRVLSSPLIGLVFLCVASPRGKGAIKQLACRSSISYVCPVRGTGIRLHCRRQRELRAALTVSCRGFSFLARTARTLLMNFCLHIDHRSGANVLLHRPCAWLKSLSEKLAEVLSVKTADWMSCQF